MFRLELSSPPFVAGENGIATGGDGGNGAAAGGDAGSGGTASWSGTNSSGTDGATGNPGPP